MTRTELWLVAIILFLLVYAIGATQAWMAEKQKAQAFTEFMQRPVLPASHFNTNSP